MVMTMGMTWARKWLWLDFSRPVSSEAALGYDFLCFFFYNDHQGSQEKTYPSAGILEYPMIFHLDVGLIDVFNLWFNAA